MQNTASTKQDGYFIVTRFNIPVAFSAGQKGNASPQHKTDIILDPAYLAARFALFEQYTVPSICQQTKTDFQWIVAFHAQTPEPFMSRILQLKETLPCFTPLFVQQEESFATLLSGHLTAQQYKRYIIARIDNDDAFHSNFVQALALAAQDTSQANYFVTFPLGMQYHVKHDIAAYYTYNFNHFFALVTTPASAAEKVKSPLAFNHTKLNEYFPVKSVTLQTPMWLEVVHDTNVSNIMFFTHKTAVGKRNVLALFGVNLQLKPFAFLRAMWHLTCRRTAKLLRLFAQKNIRSQG